MKKKGPKKEDLLLSLLSSYCKFTISQPTDSVKPRYQIVRLQKQYRLLYWLSPPTSLLNGYWYSFPAVKREKRAADY